jgi:hypothetical protein
LEIGSVACLCRLSSASDELCSTGSEPQTNRRQTQPLSCHHTHPNQVDRGSDEDEPSLVAGLPLTDQAAAALGRAERQAPYCQLSPGYAHRRITREDRPHYDDAGQEAGGGGWGADSGAQPGFDLRSVADSMRKVGVEGLGEGALGEGGMRLLVSPCCYPPFWCSPLNNTTGCISAAPPTPQVGRSTPWELPSVRQGGDPAALSLDELRRYRHQYPYSTSPDHSGARVRHGRQQQQQQQQRVSGGLEVAASDASTYGGTAIGQDEGAFIFVSQPQLQSAAHPRHHRPQHAAAQPAEPWQAVQGWGGGAAPPARSTHPAAWRIGAAAAGGRGETEDILGTTSDSGHGGSSSSDARAASARRQSLQLQALAPALSPVRTGGGSSGGRWVGRLAAGGGAGDGEGRRHQQRGQGSQSPARRGGRQQQQQGDGAPVSEPVFSLALWDYVR